MAAQSTAVSTYELQDAADCIATLKAIRKDTVMRPAAIIMSLDGFAGRSHRCLECAHLSDIRE